MTRGNRSSNPLAGAKFKTFMYSLDNEILKVINTLPDARKISMEEIFELRKIIYKGAYFCKKLLQKSNNIDEAIELYDKIKKFILGT